MSWSCEEITNGYFRLKHVWPELPNNGLLAPCGYVWTSTYVYVSLHFSLCLSKYNVKIIPRWFFIILCLGLLGSTLLGRTKVHLSGQRKPLLPIISALQALLIKKLSLPSSSHYFLRPSFFPFPRYLLRAKLLIELQLCDTRYYKNLSLLWFFHFLTFYTLIITCFAVFQFRLKQYSLRLFFLSFISMVIIGKRGFQEPLWKYQHISFIFKVLFSIIFFFQLVIIWILL